MILNPDLRKIEIYLSQSNNNHNLNSSFDFLKAFNKSNQKYFYLQKKDIF